jgi:predicted RNA binding protein YcfA (HicA-like mRNA interferase family)
MAKPPIESGAEAVKAFKRLGFFVDRQRGSHVVLKKITPEGERGCVIPMHQEVALGTLRSALKMAGGLAGRIFRRLVICAWKKTAAAKIILGWTTAGQSGLPKANDTG